MRKSPRPGKPKIIPVKTEITPSTKEIIHVKKSCTVESLPQTKSDMLPQKLSEKELLKSHIDQEKTHEKADKMTTCEEGEKEEEEEYGIDFDFADMLYDFFRKEKINGENKKLYSYIVDVFENKTFFDEEILDNLGIDKVINDLDAKFKLFLKENEYENCYPPITREILDIYLDVNLDQDYEDDGWVVDK